MLYTRKGDSGSSGLFGTKERLPKNSAVYEALGTLDELNSLLGFCRGRLAHSKRHPPRMAILIERVQQCLFIAQASVAGSPQTLTQAHVDELEQAIAQTETHLTEPRAFIVPGATETSGMLDFARAVSRRAERTVVAVATERKLSPATVAYLNRLSSLLYALARCAAAAEGAAETSPAYN